MRKWWKMAAAPGALAGAALVAWAPWAAAPPLEYETVSGYPMQLYFRNVGNSPVEVIAAGGLPALSDEPLSQEKLDAYLATVRARVQRARSLVRGGEYVKFVVDDPEGLAWVPGKTEHTTYLYLFAVIELPRPAPFNARWVRELCLVSKTHEPFTRCETHNEIYAGS